MSLSACTIQIVQPYHNPNEGRGIINSNFECLSGAVSTLESIVSSGTTSVTSSAATVFTSGSSGSYSIKAINDSAIDATGNYSYAEGDATKSIGYASHSEGQQTTATGITSHAEGYFTIANGDYAHAEGEETTASGQSSHSEGRFTTASGHTSHSQGEYTLASGPYSHAGGAGYTSGGAKNVLSSGIASFAHFKLTSGGVNKGAQANYSTILGGLNQNINTGAQSSGIFGGETNVINTNVLRSVIIGGSNITATANDTVYVPDFVIKKSAAVPTGTTDSIGETGSVTWDNNGFIYWKTPVGWLRTSGSTF